MTTNFSLSPILRRYTCCGQKIAYFLKKEHDVNLSVPKIYEVLAEKYVLRCKLRSKWKKNKVRGDVCAGMCARRCAHGDAPTAMRPRLRRHAR